MPKGATPHRDHKTTPATKRAVAPRRRKRAKLSPPAILLLGLVVPFAHSTQAVEIHYARAIGHEFLPETRRPTTPSESTPRETPSPPLPSLGEPANDPAPNAGEKQTNTWTKVLIGMVVVGAIAALGNRGGGDEGSSSTGTSGSTAPATNAPPSDGGGIGIGGGGITIEGGGKRGRGRDD